MLNWYILQRTRWFNPMHYLNDQTFAQSMTQTMKTWLCFQITCFSISLTWTYNKKLQWWMILMAVQPKHWNSFWKQHPHQWQKDWRIGESKQQIDKTIFSSKERTITKKYGPMTRNSEKLSWSWNSRTPGQNWDIQCSTTTLLVARTQNICKELCIRM